MNNLDWRHLSYAYIFAILENRRFIDGINLCLHPEASFPYEFLLDTLNRYRALPTLLHLKERFNLDPAYHAAPGFTIEEIADRLRTEKVKYDAQALVVHVQKLLTSQQPVRADDFITAIQSSVSNIIPAHSGGVYRLSDYPQHVNHFLSGEGHIKVCDYGFPSFDSQTGGIGQGQLIVLFANTSEGKSTLARAIAANIAAQGKTALYFTLEEPGRKSVIKTLSHLTRTNSSAILENTISHDAYRRISALGRIPGDVIFIDRVDNKGVAEIARYANQFKPDVIFLDQLPLFTKNFDQGHEAMGAMSRELKSYTQSSKIPMILLTQATRLAKQKKNPTLEDAMALAYAMAQDGDVIWFLHPTEEGMELRKKVSNLKCRDRRRNFSVDLVWNLDQGIVAEQANTLETIRQGAVSYANFNVGAQQKPVHQGTYNQAMGSPQTYRVGMVQ